MKELVLRSSIFPVMCIDIDLDQWKEKGRGDLNDLFESILFLSGNAKKKQHKSWIFALNFFFLLENILSDIFCAMFVSSWKIGSDSIFFKKCFPCDAYFGSRKLTVTLLRLNNSEIKLAYSWLYHLRSFIRLTLIHGLFLLQTA